MTEQRPAPATPGGDGGNQVDRRLRIRIIAGVCSLVLYIVVFFLMAGRWDWLRGWSFIVLMVTCQTIHSLYLRRASPELFRRRIGIGANTKRWDKFWLVGFMILYLSILFIAALDAGRYAWSGMPVWLWPAGACLYIVSLVFLSWVMAVNPFFEKTVRIQHDRNHKVIDTGPYRFVRHPGYAGIIPGFILSPPLILGSWWAMIPSGLTICWMFLRTMLEDRTLRSELDGYEEYARRVRYRLIPFLW